MAGVNVGVAYVDIRPDLSQFGTQLRSEVTRDIARTGQEAGRSLKESLVGAAQGALAAFGATFAALKIKQFFADAIGAASDLNESVTKVGVVFGSSAGEIESFASTAARSLGLSRQQALEAAGTFGNLFIAMGIGGTAAAGMSTKLVALASDLASFNNVNPEDALLALRSGLVGETEPLRRFGVNLNEATLRQKALELGLRSNTATLGPAVKAQAAYALIFEQTGTAQGDFARTSDGLANQQRILTAEWSDAKSELGNGLLPVMVDLAHIMTEDVIPAFKVFFLSSDADVNGWASTLREVITDTVGFLVQAFGGIARLVANVISAVPGGWGEGAADNLRAVADGADDMARTLHASTAELLAWKEAAGGAATSGTLFRSVVKDFLPELKAATGAVAGSAEEMRDLNKATRDSAAADRDLKHAKKDLAALILQGAVDEEKVVAARKSLVDATRAATHADRDLAKAEKEHAGALAYATLYPGLDSAQEALADSTDKLTYAQENAADAHTAAKDAALQLARAQAGDPDFQDKVADARDRVADATDKIATTTDAVAKLTPALTGAMKGTAGALNSAKDAAAGLNTELGFTKQNIEDILRLTAPDAVKSMQAWLTAGGLLGPAPAPAGPALPAFTLPAFGTPLSAAPVPALAGPTVQFGPAAPAPTTNNVTVNVTEPVRDPGLLGKSIAWALS